MNNGWIVGYEQTTNAIVVSSSYSMVGEINHLANPFYEAVTEVLLFLKKIHNLKAKPQCTKANEEEGHNAGSQCIYGYTKHNVWPAPVLSNC
jgi:hypothetical protein